MRYVAVLEKQPDGGYCVTIPALPGCISQGGTRQEALHNIVQAAELYLDDCRAAGDPVPEDAVREFVELEIGIR